MNKENKEQTKKQKELIYVRGVPAKVVEALEDHISELLEKREYHYALESRERWKNNLLVPTTQVFVGSINENKTPMTMKGFLTYGTGLHDDPMAAGYRWKDDPAKPVTYEEAQAFDKKFAKVWRLVRNSDYIGWGLIWLKGGPLCFPSLIKDNEIREIVVNGLRGQKKKAIQELNNLYEKVRTEHRDLWNSLKISSPRHQPPRESDKYNLLTVSGEGFSISQEVNYRLTYELSLDFAVSVPQGIANAVARERIQQVPGRFIEGPGMTCEVFRGDEALEQIAQHGEQYVAKAQELLKRAGVNHEPADAVYSS